MIWLLCKMKSTKEKLMDTGKTSASAYWDVRHAKVKIKVSGCFRSMEGAKEFAKINSVLSTARKHGIAVIDTIMATLAQASCIPWALASE